MSNNPSRLSDPEAVAVLSAARADPALALLIESALALRAHDDDAAQALGGLFLDRETPSDLSPDTLARTLSTIQGADTAPAPRPRYAGAPISIPDFLVAPVSQAEAAGGWRTRAPGIKCLTLQTAGQATAEVLHIEPGRSAPRHTHTGAEYTLCLYGGFSDETGRYGTGDIAAADPGVTHTPTADLDGPCLVLMVSEGGLVFTGLLGALQRLFSR